MTNDLDLQDLDLDKVKMNGHAKSQIIYFKSHCSNTYKTNL